MPESKHRRRHGRQVQRNQRSAAAATITRPRRKKANKLYVVASAVIALLVIGGFAIGGTNFSRGAPTGGSEGYQEGLGVEHPIMAEYFSNSHVRDSERVSYSTTPPTSGSHWDRWAQCGFYSDGVPDERITHNLEHGNIVVSHNLTNPEEVERLRSFLDGLSGFSNWGVARSYDKLGEGKVAVATWGVLSVMEGIDEEEIARFFTTYFGNLGPESVSCRTLPFPMDEAPDS